jgi:putative endonuclease
MSFFVYILTNKSYTLYVGSSKNLPRRIKEHTRKKFKTGFTAKYNLNKLIYFEEFNTNLEAVQMERKIKGWTRKKKIELIKTQNPKFENLLEESETSSEILR